MSAYRLFVELSRQHLPSPSSLELGKGLWNGIWKLRVPQKVWHFLWKAVREALPTKFNLCKRQVVADGLCEQCRDSAKDSIHVLWFCDSVKPIWMSDQRFSFWRSKRFSEFEDLVCFLYGEISSKLVEFFAMVAWSIWERRNRVQERQKVWGIDEVCTRASKLLKEFHDVHRKIPRLVIWSGDIR